MDIIENALASIQGGSVLDVATREGGFIETLHKHIQDYTRITGIDIDPIAISKAKRRLNIGNIHFCLMDGENLAFETSGFDTVSISASLHHLKNIHKVLSEMVRILTPGGQFILVEMHSSSLVPPEQTYISLHNWVAEVDTAMGKSHNPILPRQFFLDCVKALGLRSIQVFDQHDRDADPLDRNRIKRLDDLINRTILRLEGLPGKDGLLTQGEILRQRLHTIGACREPILVITAKKVLGNGE
jgi:SAM-dependent methyltransferase